MVSRREEHENYLKKILSESITSENPSEEAFKRFYKDAPVYFNQLKTGLVNKYEGCELLDIEGSEICENRYGECLKIIYKEKMDFSLDKGCFLYYSCIQSANKMHFASADVLTRKDTNAADSKPPTRSCSLWQPSPFSP